MHPHPLPPRPPRGAPPRAPAGAVVCRATCALLVAGVLVVLLVSVPPSPSVAAQAPPAAAQEIGTSETEVAAFLPAFRQAWASGDMSRVLPLFVPEAVVGLNYREPGGPLEYRGGVGPTSLRDGVALLLNSESQPDLATSQTAPIVFGGAPATAVRCAYRGPSFLPGVPSEVGFDELVLQGGQVVAYTRTPDGTNEAARVLALSRTMASLAAQAAGATEGADVGGGRGRPGAQGQGTPEVGPWILVTGLSLLAVVVLAALKRSNEGQWPHAPRERL